jgi:predicted SAM-dependent methyltransferase
MKLHIGPGKAYLDGWVNADIFSSVKADIYCSALAIPYPRESFDLIYASHVLEHFERSLIKSALTHWKDLLVPGGILRVAVPNFDSVVKWYISGGQLKDLYGLLYGGQDNFINFHKTVFNFYELKNALLDVGFKSVCYYDWGETEHSSIDDYSQAYLPHMDKENGMLMSLNVEALK